MRKVTFINLKKEPKKCQIKSFNIKCFLNKRNLSRKLRFFKTNKRKKYGYTIEVQSENILANLSPKGVKFSI